MNAIIGKYSGPRHPFFVISPIARGGFSGGPVLSEHGFLLGVFLELLIENHAPTELGFGAAISVEPVWNLLHEHGVYPASNAQMLREIYDDIHDDSKPPEHDGVDRLA